MLDLQGQAKDIVPMGAHMLDVQSASDHGLQPRIFPNCPGNLQLGIAQIADTRREAESQYMHEREHVVREAGRVRVVLLDAQV